MFIKRFDFATLITGLVSKRSFGKIPPSLLMGADVWISEGYGGESPVFYKENTS